MGLKCSALPPGRGTFGAMAEDPLPNAGMPTAVRYRPNLGGHDDQGFVTSIERDLRECSAACTFWATLSSPLQTARPAAGGCHHSASEKMTTPVSKQQCGAAHVPERKRKWA